MQRRSDGQIVRAFGAAMIIVAFTAVAHAQQDPPNIVLIMADDLGYGDISAYGGWIETPHLDALAREGLRFTDFHSSGNVCSPTRAGLLTGRYQQRAGLTGVIYADPLRAEHTQGIADAEWTFAEAFRSSGYATAMYGKWHLGYLPEFNPTRHGFDHFRGFLAGNVDYHTHIDQAGAHDWWIDDQRRDEPGYLTHLINDHAVDFINANRERPFLLYLPHAAPHYPHQGPADPAQRRAWGDTGVTRTEGETRRAYREMVQAMDDGIGRIVDTLNATGIRDNTLIWFFSDNGAARWGSNGPLRGGKGSDWEGGHRVPAVVNWPTKIQSGLSDELVSTIDVMPTILALAGYSEQAARAFDGISLAGLLLRGETVGPRQMYWSRGGGRAMRDGDWKLIIDPRPNTPNTPMLFHLDKDLAEQHDLATQHPERVRRMQDALASWRNDVAP